MWKDWLERTLTRNKAPAMLAPEIMCDEPAKNRDLSVALSSDKAQQFHADGASEKVEV
jgi:hypothetical protein